MVTVEARSRSGETAAARPASQSFEGTREGSRPAVVYSIGARIGGGGIGDVAAEAVRGLLGRRILRRLLIMEGSVEGAEDRTVRFPARIVRNRLANRFLSDALRDVLYDCWATRHMDRCNVFYGWANYSLLCLRRARRQGAVTLIDRGCAEARRQHRLLAEESRSLGMGDGPMPDWLVRRMVAEYDEADCIVVPSTFAYETFRDVGYPEDRLFINPLGVDIHRFRPPSSPEGTFRVVFLGRGSVQKGVVYLLRAWRRLDLPGGELILAGPIEPGAKEILHRELQRVRAGTVRIVGPVGNPEAVLRESSVLVLPSVQDGFGLVVLEAMACGVPVIVSENVGAKDCVREGIDGFVVPVRDADAIAARLEWLHGHPTQRGGMGARARERAMSYSWDAYRSRLAEKIQALADRRTPAGSGQ